MGRSNVFKRVLGIFLMLALCLGLSAQEKDGRALIDKLNLMYKTMADKGTGGETEVVPGLEALWAEAKKAREQNAIDPAFFRRYQRVLTVLRLMVMPGKQGVLSPVMQREIGSFVEDVNGMAIEISRKEAIGEAVSAVVNEIMNLYLYDDALKARAKLLKEFEKKYGVKK
jgi:hypothetical protein